MKISKFQRKCHQALHLSKEPPFSLFLSDFSVLCLCFFLRLSIFLFREIVSKVLQVFYFRWNHLTWIKIVAFQFMKVKIEAQEALKLILWRRPTLPKALRQILWRKFSVGIYATVIWVFWLAAQIFFKWALPGLFFFIFVFSIQLTVKMFNLNFCRRDSNRGPLESEATTLPTEPQPLPKFIVNQSLCSN